MNIVHLSFSHRTHLEAVALLKGRHPDASLIKDPYCTAHVCDLFQQFIKGERQHIAYSLRTPFYEEATDFQKSVWKRISRIGYGQTRTYGELASAMGSARLARAVGMACNHNPLALLIPCHRVVEKNGLGGFSGGVALKSRLLAIEGAKRQSGETVSGRSERGEKPPGKPKRRVGRPRKPKTETAKRRAGEAARKHVEQTPDKSDRSD